jgi:16S rRNA processing protein RimM
VGVAPDPTAPDAEFPADAVEVGRIVDAWGIKGWLRVQSYAPHPQALFSSKRWFLRAADGAAPGSMLPPLLRIVEAREHGDGVVASVRGVVDRTSAEALRGARIFVARSSFPTAADGEYYWVDLIGARVFNRQGEPLGEVASLIDNGVHSVLRVREPGATDDRSDRLIPFVAAYIDHVDAPGKRIDVDWGLDY